MPVFRLGGMNLSDNRNEIPDFSPGTAIHIRRSEAPFFLSYLCTDLLSYQLCLCHLIAGGSRGQIKKLGDTFRTKRRVVDMSAHRGISGIEMHAYAGVGA